MIQVFEFFIDILQYYFIFQLSLIILLGKDHHIKKTVIIAFSIFESLAYHISRELFIVNNPLLHVDQLLLSGLHFIILLYLTKKLWFKPLASLIYITLLGVPAYLFLIIITMVFNLNDYVHIGFLGSLTLTPYYYFLYKFLKNDHYGKIFKQIKNIFHKFSFLFLFISIIGIIPYFGKRNYGGFFDDFLVLASRYFYVLTILFALLSIHFIKKFQYVKQHLSTQIKSLSENTNTIHILYEDMKKYQMDVSEAIHDVTHHLKDEDFETLSKKFLLNTMSLNETNLTGFEPLLHLKNLHIPSIKGLLFNKYNQAKKNNVSIKMGIIDTLTDLSVNDIDLCRMVGILIDNAIEAAENSKEKNIHIIFDKISHDNKEKWQIQISNTYNGSSLPTGLSGKWKSTKGSGRGLGLKSLKVILKKYHHVSLTSLLEKESVTQILTFKM